MEPQPQPETDILKHLTGVLKEFPCLKCGYMNIAVFTSQIHFQNCLMCKTTHELEILEVNVSIKIAPEDDLT